jgi:serine/threonine protein kinase
LVKNPYFAVKWLSSGKNGKKAFRNEVIAWKSSVRNTNHPHLISLLATWRQCDNWYLLFPWAHGNLRDFWYENRTPKPDASLVRWMAKQCLGIAEGLRKIHGSDSDIHFESSIHGNIKPENILYFKQSDGDYGTLVICDFGFTQFHSSESRFDASSSPLGFSGTYRAPEINALHGRIISRTYDTWTLGCLYLEFVSWYLTGWDGVQNIFVTRRLEDDVLDEDESILSDKFFNIQGGKTAVVKHSVLRVGFEHFFECADANQISGSNIFIIMNNAVHFSTICWLSSRMNV